NCILNSKLAISNTIQFLGPNISNIIDIKNHISWDFAKSV
ncbi:23720_t:CDS:1, partial [Cetraspora pellucida]